MIHKIQKVNKFPTRDETLKPGNYTTEINANVTKKPEEEKKEEKKDEKKKPEEKKTPLVVKPKAPLKIDPKTDIKTQEKKTSKLIIKIQFFIILNPSKATFF